MKSDSQILTKIFTPLVIITIVSAILLSLYITNQTKKNIISNSTVYALNTIKQYKMLRQYYTKYVIEKIPPSMYIDYIHKNLNNTLPLPATMLKDLSVLLGQDKNGTHINLYSNYPFPNSKNRKLDDFSKRALIKFKDNKQKDIIEITTRNNKKVLRVATPDYMTQNTCVNCHNSREDSPKKDWKLGDVRGVLEVIIPINKELELAQSLNIQIIILILFLVNMILLILYFYFKKNILKPYKHLYDERKKFY
ncbi:MAG: hypothetical protein COA66_01535 [Arcobacter sp.]|nr:MAG: hypothetical protein COA66_01535 [Arcobacter sp.]